MAFIQLQSAPWDKVYWLESDLPGLKIFDRIIIKTDAGQDLARIIDISQTLDKPDELDKELSIVRLAENQDLLRQASSDEECQAALFLCRQMIETHNLSMKLVDAHFSWDGSRITFAFVAEGRVDFRALVKDLSRYFNKSIRLQQIGIRDEARVIGDAGRCGRGLCCQNNLVKFNSVTSDMAESQSLSTRGSDRISGSCGRLMCCLAYEVEGYKAMSKKMPPLGSKVTVDGRKGTVIGHHLLKQSVDVEFVGEKGEDRVIAEVDLNRHAKKTG
ncbi:MAG: regulatory iron-sulfur-containing complex subunit RicT [Candidatus Falkowbacteria bacterium]